MVGVLLTKRRVARWIPTRRPDSHKGDNGRVLVVGGSEQFVGAPALAALAALRSGADLAVIAAPEQAAWIINSFSPDLITIKLPGRVLTPRALQRLGRAVQRSDAVVLGPGLGDMPATLRAVRVLLSRLRNKKAVVDADALKALPSSRLSRRWVLTPHRGEFERIVGKALSGKRAKDISVMRVWAEKQEVTLLLKSPRDVVVAPDGKTALNPTGNAGMTVGGTGDVLAGIVGALLAQGLQPFEAACCAAWICGRAGDLCAREKGYEFVASDVIEKLPEVFAELRRVR